MAAFTWHAGLHDEDVGAGVTENFERIEAVLARRVERRLAEYRSDFRRQPRIGVDRLFRGGAKGCRLAGDSGKRADKQRGQNERDSHDQRRPVLNALSPGSGRRATPAARPLEGRKPILELRDPLVDLRLAMREPAEQLRLQHQFDLGAGVGDARSMSPKRRSRRCKGLDDFRQQHRLLLHVGPQLFDDRQHQTVVGFRHWACLSRLSVSTHRLSHSSANIC